MLRKENIAMLLSKFRLWAVKHQVLMRSLRYAIILVCIPLMLFLFLLTEKSRKNIFNAWEASSETVAETAASHFAECVHQMFLTAQNMAQDSKLFDYNFNKNTRLDTRILDTMQYFKNTLPFVSSCCLYSMNMGDVIYTSDGKYNLHVYISNVLHISPTDFMKLVNESNKMTFLPADPDTNDVLCAIPFYSRNLNLPHRMCIFTIPQSKLFKTLNSIIEESRHNLAAIFDANSQMIFYNSACPIARAEMRHMDAAQHFYAQDDYTYFISRMVNGYSAITFVSNDSYAMSVAAFEESLKIIITVNIFVAILIAIVLTWINYQPIINMLNSMGLKRITKKNEFDAIIDAYASQEKKVADLKNDNKEKQLMLRGYIIEKLLNGSSISKEEEPVINDIIGCNGYFFVAVASSDEISDLADLEYKALQQNCVFPFEMRRDGYILFLCRINSPSERTALAKLVQQAVNAKQGVGGIDTGWKKIHSSYLEAILAFDKGTDALIAFYEDLKQIATDADKNWSMELMQIARMLKNGDESALAEIDVIFDDISNKTSYFFFQRYYCFQLLECLRNILKKLDICISKENIAQMLSQNNLADIHDACIRTLTASLNDIKRIASERETTLASKMKDIVESQYADYEFGLNNIAAACNMTEYSASRIFKEVVGVSFKKFVTSKRIASAKKLLNESDANISDIAQQVGFFSCSYFIRVFKAEEGITPAAYRQGQSLDRSEEPLKK